MNITFLEGFSYITFALLIALSVFELLAQFFLKSSLSVLEKSHYTPILHTILYPFQTLSTSSQSVVLLIIGMLVYAFTGLLFWESLKHKSFGVVGLLWHVMMALLTLIISIVIFNDTYTKKDVIGFGFGLVSLALLLSNHHH